MSYKENVDLWFVGCIMDEMVRGYVVLHKSCMDERKCRNFVTASLNSWDFSAEHRSDYEYFVCRLIVNAC